MVRPRRFLRWERGSEWAEGKRSEFRVWRDHGLGAFFPFETPVAHGFEEGVVTGCLGLRIAVGVGRCG